MELVKVVSVYSQMGECNFLVIGLMALNWSNGFVIGLMALWYIHDTCIFSDNGYIFSDAIYMFGLELLTNPESGSSYLKLYFLSKSSCSSSILSSSDKSSSLKLSNLWEADKFFSISETTIENAHMTKEYNMTVKNKTEWKNLKGQSRCWRIGAPTHTRHYFALPFSLNWKNLQD